MRLIIATTGQARFRIGESCSEMDVCKRANRRWHLQNIPTLEETGDEWLLEEKATLIQKIGLV